MHSVEELGTNVPAFLAKLWKIVEDPETNDLICWNPGGTSFYIRNQARFARELLPLYYKHNNMASFVRQLNMYGFHKVVSIDGGGLKVDKDEMEFAHQYFIMGHPYLLEHIKRKIPTSKMEEGRTSGKPEMMNKVLADVKSMKGRQDSLDSQLSSMKRENEVLWREVAILRQKHLKQQQIVNKLIQFLVTMVQSSRNGGIGIKRHYPLMLNDTSHRPAKSPKVGPEISDLNSGPNARSPTGPVIHELDTAELLEDCGENAETTTTEDYLPSDFCSVVIDGEQNQARNVDTSEIAPDSPHPTANNPNPEVLLDLAEECPLSPSMLLTASPLDVNPAIVTPRLSKGKSRSRLSSFEGKKRRSKRGNASSKIIAETSARSTSVKATSITPEEETLANGVDLLNVVLPTLVNDRNVNLLEKSTDDIEEADAQNGVLLTPDALAAATNEAISAISSVAAASKKELSKSTASQDSKSISLPTVMSLLPDTKGKCESTVVDSSLADNDANSNASLNTDDLLVFKQEPSTSSDKRTSPSNMVLACTGNSDDSIFNRVELDSHVDAVQNELDGLRELLKGEGYSLDANTLLGVCAAIPAFEQDFLKLFSDDPLTSTFENLPGDREKENTAGSELATYSSNLLDMVDMFEGCEADQWSSPSTPESSNIMDVSLSELNTPQMSVVSPGSVSKKLK